VEQIAEVIVHAPCGELLAETDNLFVELTSEPSSWVRNPMVASMNIVLPLNPETKDDGSDPNEVDDNSSSMNLIKLLDDPTSKNAESRKESQSSQNMERRKESQSFQNMESRKESQSSQNMEERRENRLSKNFENSRERPPAKGAESKEGGQPFKDSGGLDTDDRAASNIFSLMVNLFPNVDVAIIYRIMENERKMMAPLNDVHLLQDIVVARITKFVSGGNNNAEKANNRPSKVENVIEKNEVYGSDSAMTPAGTSVTNNNSSSAKRSIREDVSPLQIGRIGSNNFND
jgi:hypothetical protein